mgnify:CR=1 FL=1|tara:strand:+ start:219 stop:422 length:204 start_codon:yes stop_codon:yes gene_type:complete
MKETIEQIQKDRINILNKTIDILSRINKRDEEQINILKHTIELDKITIKTQEDTIKIYLDVVNTFNE